MEPVRSTASIVAIACAIGSFVLSSQAHVFWGFMTAIIAVLAGLVGFLRAASPRVSGGMISLASVVLGAIAMLYALIRVAF